MIIESISSSKRIQCTNKYAPWIDSNFINQAKIRDNLHMVAKKSNSEGDWRIFRQQRNLVNNLNKANKNNYYKSKLNITKKDDFSDISVEGSKNMWRTVKDLTGNCKQTPPRTISFDGELITSVKKYVIWPMSIIFPKFLKLDLIFLQIFQLPQYKFWEKLYLGVKIISLGTYGRFMIAIYE